MQKQTSHHCDTSESQVYVCCHAVLETDSFCDHLRKVCHSLFGRFSSLPWLNGACQACSCCQGYGALCVHWAARILALMKGGCSTCHIFSRASRSSRTVLELLVDGGNATSVWSQRPPLGNSRFLRCPLSRIFLHVFRLSWSKIKELSHRVTTLLQPSSISKYFLDEAVVKNFK